MASPSAREAAGTGRYKAHARVQDTIVLQEATIHFASQQTCLSTASRAKFCLLAQVVQNACRKHQKHCATHYVLDGRLQGPCQRGRIKVTHLEKQRCSGARDASQHHGEEHAAEDGQAKSKSALSGRGASRGATHNAGPCHSHTACDPTKHHCHGKSGLDLRKHALTEVSGPEKAECQSTDVRRRCLKPTLPEIAEITG